MTQQVPRKGLYIYGRMSALKVLHTPPAPGDNKTSPEGDSVTPELGESHCDANTGFGPWNLLPRLN